MGIWERTEEKVEVKNCGGKGEKRLELDEISRNSGDLREWNLAEAVCLFEHNPSGQKTIAKSSQRRRGKAAERQGYGYRMRDLKRIKN